MKRLLNISCFLLCTIAISAQDLKLDLKDCFDKIFTARSCAFDIEYNTDKNAIGEEDISSVKMKYQLMGNNIRCDFENTVIIKTPRFFLQLNKDEKSLIFKENKQANQIDMLGAFANLDFTTLNHTFKEEGSIRYYSVFKKGHKDQILAKYEIDTHQKIILKVKMYSPIPYSKNKWAVKTFAFSNYRWNTNISKQKFAHSSFLKRKNGQYRLLPAYASYELLNMGDSE